MVRKSKSDTRKSTDSLRSTSEPSHVSSGEPQELSNLTRVMSQLRQMEMSIFGGTSDLEILSKRIGAIEDAVEMSESAIGALPITRIAQLYAVCVKAGMILDSTLEPSLTPRGAGLQ